MFDWPSRTAWRVSEKTPEMIAREAMGIHCLRL